MRQRLSKVLAVSGIASRRACENLIFNGRVKVNGTIIYEPQFDVKKDDRITIDNKPIPSHQQKVYYILNKPCGYICSNKKLQNEKIVLDLFKGIKTRIFTIGRLDKETTGLLLVTNDGIFSNLLIHPSSNIEKEYIAKVDQFLTHDHLVMIEKGTLIEKKFVRPIKIEKIRKNTLRLVVKEGKKHEVRKLLQRANLHILTLKRIRIGPLTLGNLPEGYFRPLRPSERKSVLDYIQTRRF